MERMTCEGSFRRGVSPERLARLQELAHRPGWWRDLLRLWQPSGNLGGLRLAVRNAYLNFYVEGQSVARIGFGRGDSPYACVHHKYLDRARPVGSPYLRFGPNDGFDILSTMKRACDHVSEEKRCIERFVAANHEIIDLEMGLPAQGERTAPLRMDLVALEDCEARLRIVFWEAKRVGDRRLRRREGPAEVVRQSEAYRAYVTANGPPVIQAYREAARTLAALHDTALESGAETGPLGDHIVQIASGAELDVDSSPRLLVFADGAERSAAAWSAHLAKLRHAGLLVHVADEQEVKLPTAAELTNMPPPALIAPVLSTDFARRERKRQAAWLANSSGFDVIDDILLPSWPCNIDPAHRALAAGLFEAEPAIRPHRWAHHGLSSQAACLNFLLPMIERPDLLSRWIERLLGIEGVEVETIETRAGADRLIAFEWFPDKDYLNGGGGKERTRGANATSLDAAIRFRHAGTPRLLLVEWKYSESYGETLSGNHATRDSRYGKLWRWPDGPVHAELALRDFYREPFYQLLRQQMLAHAIERDPESGYGRADLVHISPAQNSALRKITAAPFKDLGGDAFEAFRATLADELADRFRSVTVEAAFAPIRDDAAFEYVRDRYDPLLAVSRR